MNSILPNSPSLLSPSNRTRINSWVHQQTTGSASTPIYPPPNSLTSDLDSDHSSVSTFRVFAQGIVMTFWPKITTDSESVNDTDLLQHLARVRRVLRSSEEQI